MREREREREREGGTLSKHPLNVQKVRKIKTTYSKKHIAKKQQQYKEQVRRSVEAVF